MISVSKEEIQGEGKEGGHKERRHDRRNEHDTSIPLGEYGNQTGQSSSGCWKLV